MKSDFNKKEWMEMHAGEILITFVLVFVVIVLFFFYFNFKDLSSSEKIIIPIANLASILGLIIYTLSFRTKHKIKNCFKCGEKTLCKQVQLDILLGDFPPYYYPVEYFCKKCYDYRKLKKIKQEKEAENIRLKERRKEQEQYKKKRDKFLKRK